jgi:hypothetical protein
MSATQASVGGRSICSLLVEIGTEFGSIVCEKAVLAAKAAIAVVNRRNCMMLALDKMLFEKVYCYAD